MPERLCACGCGVELVTLRSNARYASDACRSRDWKRRAGYVDPRAPQPRRNVSKPRRPSAPRISYRKALDAVAFEVQHLPGYTADTAREFAVAALRPLLTDRQLEALRS